MLTCWTLCGDATHCSCFYVCIALLSCRTWCRRARLARLTLLARLSCLAGVPCLALLSGLPLRTLLP